MEGTPREDQALCECGGRRRQDHYHALPVRSFLPTFLPLGHLRVQPKRVTKVKIRILILFLLYKHG